MRCISSARMKIMWNGSLTEEFSMERGVRQGDSLSPYIFVLCMERLSHIILDSIDLKQWRPIRVSRGGPMISHLFFADDLLLFVEASCNQMRVIKDCLDKFCMFSGAKVSVEKTRLFCSKNINHNVKNDISSVSGFTLIGDLGKYLGVPLHHKRVTHHSYHFVLEKVKRRLSSWKIKKLSLAERATLVQSVLNTIPLYYMQTTLMPMKICDDIDQASRNSFGGALRRVVRLILLLGIEFVFPRRMGV